MRKVLPIAMCALLLSTAAFADYDKEATKKVMRENAALLGQVTAAADKNDFTQVSEKLKLLSEGTKSLLVMTPPKGEKTNWDKVLTEFINAADAGRAACDKSDASALKASLGEIRRLMREGHKEFR